MEGAGGMDRGGGRVGWLRAAEGGGNGLHAQRIHVGVRSCTARAAVTYCPNLVSPYYLCTPGCTTARNPFPPSPSRQPRGCHHCVGAVPGPRRPAARLTRQRLRLPALGGGRQRHHTGGGGRLHAIAQAAGGEGQGAGRWRGWFNFGAYRCPQATGRFWWPLRIGLRLLCCATTRSLHTRGSAHRPMLIPPAPPPPPPLARDQAVPGNYTMRVTSPLALQGGCRDCDVFAMRCRSSVIACCFQHLLPFLTTCVTWPHRRPTSSRCHRQRE